MATRVTIQDIANELQLSRNTVSKAINNTGVLADATREKILRKAAEMGYKQFAYLPLFQPDGPPAPEAAAAAPADAAQPDGKREIAMLTTCFLSNSHFSSLMLDRFQSEIHHLHYGMTMPPAVCRPPSTRSGSRASSALRCSITPMRRCSVSRASRFCSWTRPSPS